MRVLGVLCSAVLFACGGGKTDVQIVVHSPTDFGEDPEAELPDTVKLFVGMDESTEDAWIAPAGFKRGEEREGAYWILEYESDTQAISPGNPAEFRFVLDERAELGMVVAVGYTRGRPTSSASLFHVKNLESGGFTRYPLGLNASADAKDPRFRSRKNQLELWGENDQTCVHVENQRSDADDESHRTAFLVQDETDLDCDGFEDGDTRECSPTVYMDARPPNLDDLSCATASAGAGCRLGGASCVDGVGPDTSRCAPSRYCTTSAVCSCTTWDCVRDLQETGAGVLTGLALECITYAPYLETDAGPLALCTTPASVALLTGGRDCEAVHGATRDGGFDSKLEWEDAPASLAQRADLSATGCQLEVTPSGSLPRGAGTLKRGAVLAVDLAGGRGLAIPVLLKFVPLLVSTDELSNACALPQAQTTCHLLNNQVLPTDVESCLTAAPP